MNYVKKFIEKVESVDVVTLIFIIGIVGFLLYAKALFGDFVWDDKFEIVNNPSVHSFNTIQYAFTGGTFSNGISLQLGGEYYRPLKTVVMTFLYVFGFGAPFLFHFFDISLHICNVVLLFILLKKIFKAQAASHPQFLACILSLLFLVHPTQVESVALIASSGVVMYLFFLLCMLLLLFSGIGEKLSPRRIFFIELCFLGSLLSLEQGIIGFFLIIIFSFLFLRSQLMKLFFSSLVPLFIYGFLRFGVAHLPLISHRTYVPINVVPLWQRLLTIPFEFASYAGILLFPFHLTIYRNEIIQSIWDARLWFGLIVVVLELVLVGWVYLHRKSKMIFFFLLWLVLHFGMISNILPLDMTLAERWLYGPLVPLLAVVGMVLIQFVQYKKIMPLIYCALFIFILCLSVRTVIRVADWQNEETLFSHDVNQEQSSYALFNEYGAILLKQRMFDQAKTVFLKSIKLYPNQSEAYDNIAITAYNQGKNDEAKTYFRLAIQHATGSNANNKPFDNYARFLLLTDTPEHTLSFVLESLKLYSWSPMLNMIAAQIYYHDKEYEKASFYAARAGVPLDSLINN